MDSLRKRILLDLFVTPGTMIATVVGMSFILLSWIIPSLFALGLITLLIGFGVLATNFVFNLGKISSKAADEWYKKELAEREDTLDDLDVKLSKDKDKKDEQILRNLRVIYGDFCEDVKHHKISEAVTPEMLAQVDEIFRTSVASLEYSFELLTMSKKLGGSLKEDIEKQREGIMADVEKSVAALAATLAGIRKMKTRAKRSQMTVLQKQLSQSLEVARQVDAIRTEVPIEEKYQEYLKTQ